MIDAFRAIFKSPIFFFPVVLVSLVKDKQPHTIHGTGICTLTLADFDGTYIRHTYHTWATWVLWAILTGFSHHIFFWSRHLMSRCFAGESKNRPGTLASESHRVCIFDICICTLQGINISHLGKRKLIFKNALVGVVGDMLIPRMVSQFSQLKLNHWKEN